MNPILYLLGHIGVTAVALVTMVLRIEHRLTKIETDISWIKDKNGCGDDEEK